MPKINDGTNGYVEICGRVRRVGPYLAIDLPDGLFVSSTLRRVNYQIDQISARGFARRLSTGGLALILDNASTRRLALAEGESIKARVMVLPDRTRASLPPDVVAAVRDSGFSLDAMSEPDIRHLITMVQEAKSAKIRAQRLSSFLNSLRC